MSAASTQGVACARPDAATAAAPQVVVPAGPRLLQKACILGAGAFGTALAQLLARNGVAATVWTRSEDTMAMINSQHLNTPYLAEIQLSPNVVATTSVAEAMEGADLVLFAIPTPFLREFLVSHRDLLPMRALLLICSKGIENVTLLTPFEILEEELPGKYHKFLACLSGPSFAREVALGKPTSVTVAARDLAVAQRVQMAISDKNFRVYTSNDIMGVEVFGAVKNVLAIACGSSDGLDFGLNARAALITRGMAEIARLAIRKGASPLSMGGLCGVGDLVLTCTGSLSRNWTVGYRLAQGETLGEIKASTRQVAEGVATAQSVHDLAASLGIDLPICEEVYQVLYKDKRVIDALATLQGRPLTDDLHLELGQEGAFGVTPAPSTK
ncbi:glycerol-3-phosphate dehydrogenase [Tribonema minus]|uniref:Glycerol-3-phosphate dehydrogenase [NAD(+)] n=1 Tax=Tribonema minus TaxID=303371 RepID=A0A836CAJ5_9STRA|nr:glycerol-3-phosphate dehydrogenase [Tribonema minus]